MCCLPKRDYIYVQKRKLGGNEDVQTAEMKRNPKAFTNKSRMKAKLQRVRSAEKEQKRMHGARRSPAAHPDVRVTTALSPCSLTEHRQEKGRATIWAAP